MWLIATNECSFSAAFPALQVSKHYKKQFTHRDAHLSEMQVYSCLLMARLRQLENVICIQRNCAFSFGDAA